MNPPIATYKVVERKGNLDCAEFSLCPNCSLHIIKLDDGCSVCGWKDTDILLGGDENCSFHKFDTLNNKLSIPCLIKRPKQPEVKGIIQKDLGDRFTVYIPSNSSTVNVSKLLVYPDFSDIGDKQLLGGKSKSSSNLSKSSSKNNADSSAKVSDRSGKCSSKTNPPSTKTNKQRRQKGEGSGHIYYRTVTRNGTKYQQTYYQWRENGKQRTKYIPKNLLGDIEEAEAQKLPVTEILELLLGGLNNCSSNCSSTSTRVRCISESDELIPKFKSNFYSPPCTNLEKETSTGDRSLTKNNEEDRLDRSCSTPEDVLAKSKSDELIDNCSSKISNPPSKRRKRSSGYGGGYVEYREVKRNHKIYAQYWYHYEFWENGRCIEKKSKYIPKSKRSRVERMNRDKVPVREILEVFQSKRKK